MPEFYNMKTPMPFIFELDRTETDGGGNFRRAQREIAYNSTEGESESFSKVWEENKGSLDNLYPFLQRLSRALR